MAHVAYTTVQSVLDRGPKVGVDADTLARIPDWIAEESEAADSYLLPFTRPQPAVTDSPATPAILNKAVAMMVVARLFQAIGQLRFDDQGNPVNAAEERGLQILRDLRDGGADLG